MGEVALLPELSEFAPLAELLPDQFPEPEPPPPADREQDRSALVRLSPEQEGRLLRQLRAHYDEAETGRDENQRRRELRYRRYLTDVSLRDGLQPWEDAPQLFLPMTRVTIETLLDEFEQDLWDMFDKIQVRGFGEEDVEQAKRRQAFFSWQLEHVNDWRREGKSVLQDALVDGIGILKAYPYRQPWQPLHEEAALFDIIGKIEALDVGTLLIPPDATGLQWPKCRYLGQQLFTFLDEFPSLAKREFDLPDEEMVRAVGRVDPREQTDDERRLLGFWRDGFDAEEADYEHDPQVEMVEQYELFDIDDDGAREFVVVHWFPHLRTNIMAEGAGHLSRVMRLEDAVPQTTFLRPMWPFFEVTLWPQARQLRGLSVPDRLESSQDMLNRVAEQMIQAGEVDLLPIVFANVALAGEIPNLTRVAPGTVVPIEGLGTAGSVQFSQRPAQTRDFLQLQQVIKSWGEEDSRVTSFQQGRTPDQPNAPRTLGGTALLLQEGNKSKKQQSIHLASQFTPAFKMLHSVWQDRFQGGVKIPMPQTDAIEARLFGDQGQQALIEVRREDLSGIFDILIKHNPDQVLEMQRKLALAERLDTLLLNTWPAGRRELWKDVWESFGLQEFDRFYPEAIAAIETQIIMMQAQVALAALSAQGQQFSGEPSPLALMAAGEQVGGGQSGSVDGTVTAPSQGQSPVNLGV